MVAGISNENSTCFNNDDMLLNKDRLWKISIVLFIVAGMLLSITWTFFISYYPHPNAFPSLPTAFPYFQTYLLVILTTSFFVMAIIFLINSLRKK